MPNIDTTDEVDMKTADRERFLELADQWENETVLLSRTDMAIKHPAYPKIIDTRQGQGAHGRTGSTPDSAKNAIARRTLVRRPTRDHQRQPC